MAIGDPYIDLAELKEYLKIRDTKLSNDQALEDALTSASREVERITNRQFNVAATATARLYATTTARGRRIRIDDLSTAAGVVVEFNIDGGISGNWVTVPATDYELTPLNGVVGGVPGWPYTTLELTPYRYAWYLPYYRKSGRFRVTGVWGWPEVPSDVRQACMVLAADTYQLKDSPYGIMSDQFGALLRPSGPTAGAGTQARAKLARYNRTPLLVG